MSFMSPSFSIHSKLNIDSCQLFKMAFMSRLTCIYVSGLLNAALLSVKFMFCVMDI